MSAGTLMTSVRSSYRSDIAAIAPLIRVNLT
jgi:hypothetical protein